MTTQKKYALPTPEQEDIEEALGAVWQAQEQGTPEKQTLISLLEQSVGKDIYSKLLNRRLLQEKGSQIALAPEGSKIGQDVTRRHRLAERLLFDVLALSSQAVDPNACQLEHILSPEVAESICTLLGHPQQCPHGLPIPKGRCCQKSSESLEPIILTLDKMDAGSKGKIAYLTLQNHPDLHKLLSLGLIPGTLFNLHQTFPTYVIEVGETTLALEKEIAQKIFVRHVE